MIRNSGYFILAIFIVTACGRHRVVEGKDNSFNESEKVESTADRGPVAISINVTQTSSYCGGARPPQEMLDRMNTPRPLVGKKIFIRRGDTNNALEDPIFSGMTDQQGILKCSLEPGTYYLVFENKSNKNFYNELLKTYGEATAYYAAIDKHCLEKWLGTPELVMQVDAQHAQFSVNDHEPCAWHAIPCTQYNGPLPP